MPKIRTIGLQDAATGTIVPISVSQLSDGTYALITDERSVHKLGIGGAAFLTADTHLAASPVTDAPNLGEYLVVDEIMISSDIASGKVVVTFTEENTGKVIAKLALNTTQTLSVIGNDRIKLSGPNNRLMVQTDIAANLWVTALWYSEPYTS